MLEVKKEELKNVNEEVELWLNCNISLEDNEEVGFVLHDDLIVEFHLYDHYYNDDNDLIKYEDFMFGYDFVNNTGHYSYLNELLSLRDINYLEEQLIRISNDLMI